MLHSKVFVVEFVVSGKVLTNILNSMWIGIGEPFHQDSVVEEVHDDVMSSEIRRQRFLHTNVRNGDCLYVWAQEVPWTITTLMFLNSHNICSRYSCQVCKLASHDGSRPSS